MEAGSATPFFSPGFHILDFAVDPAGTVCYEGEGWECRRQDGSVDFPSLAGPSLAFSPGGLMYVSTWDNVWKLEGALQTPLITGAPVSGTLTVDAKVFADETSANYTYNSRSELVQVMRHPVGEEQYAYDPTGNRLSDHKASDYVFNEVNQLTAGAGAVYTYDGNGNRLSELRTLTSELTKYTWNSENRLKRIDFPDGSFAEYAYDPFGRRIQKKLVAADGTETIRRFVYDREDILFEMDGSNNVIAEYLHGPGIDEPIALRRNGQTYYYHQDALGSIVAVTDEAGSIVQRYEYDAYGSITYVLDPAFKQPYAFTGREYDEESGLYYYRARYYDPRTGRFLSKDPIGFQGGDVNLYGYVMNDPVNWADPEGLQKGGGRPQPRMPPPKKGGEPSASEGIWEFEEYLHHLEELKKLKPKCKKYVCEEKPPWPPSSCADQRRPDPIVIDGPSMISPETQKKCYCVEWGD